MLPILLFVCVQFAVVPSAHSQSCESDVESLAVDLMEMETVCNDIADQRDRCIKLRIKTASERDRCLGSADELSRIVAGLNVTVRDYERVIAKHEARKSPVVYYVAGLATVPVLAGIGFLVYLAVK